MAQSKQVKRHQSRLKVLEYFSHWLNHEFIEEPEVITAFKWQKTEVVLNVQGARAAALQRSRGNAAAVELAQVDATPAHSSFARTARAAPDPCDHAPPGWVLQQIAWEVTELAFRVEMYELDRRFVPGDEEADVKARHALLDQIFPGSKHWLTPEFPPSAPGLGAKSLCDRVACLDALRQLLARWPGFPEALRDKPLVDDTAAATAAETELAVFYCRSALQQLGRAPVVPREFPVPRTGHPDSTAHS